MVSAHWTAPVMTPVMLGQYWGEVRKHVYAPADFYSPDRPPRTIHPWQTFYFILAHGNIGIVTERFDELGSKYKPSQVRVAKTLKISTDQFFDLKD